MMFKPTHVLTRASAHFDANTQLELVQLEADGCSLYRNANGFEAFVTDRKCRPINDPPDADDAPYEDNTVTSDEMDHIAGATWSLPFDENNIPKLYSPNALNINIDASLRPSDGLPGYHLQRLPYE